MRDNLASPELITDPDISKNLASLAAKLSGTDMEISAACEKLIGAYLSLLSNYNQKVNLVGNCDPRLLVERHTMDGLTVAARFTREMKRQGEQKTRRRYIDIGSGGGLPGLIVALACPDLAVTLVDATGKKCQFLKKAAEELNLGDRIEVITGRAEDLARDGRLREKFDFASARAVASLKVSVELAIPFLKPGGLFVAQKTSSRIEAETAESKAILAKIGAEIEEVETLEQFDELKEALIVPVRKVRATPAEYPRSWKLITDAK